MRLVRGCLIILLLIVIAFVAGVIAGKIGTYNGY
jgi:hypothetical protein